MSYLESILQTRRVDVAEERRNRDFERLRRDAFSRCDHRDFLLALRHNRPAVIAEIKRASPALGLIAPGCDAAAIAMQYERGGAAAISVLTESRNFQGSFADLSRARAAVSLPVLCKDFVVDEFQLWKASALGADAVLLIAAALSDRELHAFVALSQRLLMEPLVECHTVAEAARALEAGTHVLGINNRDLSTFQVDTAAACRIRAAIAADVTTVAESGYRNADQIRQALAAGLDAILIGETLMRAANREEALRTLLGGIRGSSESLRYHNA